MKTGTIIAGGLFLIFGIALILFALLSGGRSFFSFDAGNAVVFPLFIQFLCLGKLLLCKGGKEDPAAPEGKMETLVVFAEKAVSPDLQTAFQGACRVVESAVDDARIRLGDPEGCIAVFFQNKDTEFVSGQTVRRRQSRYPRADDDHIVFFHKKRLNVVGLFSCLFRNRNITTKQEKSSAGRKKTLLTFPAGAGETGRTIRRALRYGG